MRRDPSAAERLRGAHRETALRHLRRALHVDDDGVVLDLLVDPIQTSIDYLCAIVGQ
jgi:hypothetical protein